MPYIIDLVDPEELAAIRKAGYEVRANLPSEFEFLGDGKILMRKGLVEAIVWVHCDVGDLLELEGTE